MDSSVAPKPRLRAKASLMILLALSVTALAVHLLPLTISNYPFNNDGLTESVASERIMESGRIALPDLANVTNTHSESTPMFNIVIAFVGSALGVEPMFISQVIVAAISVLTVVGIYLVTLMITRDRKSSIVAALFVCFFGTFLFQTASVWKVALGIPLFILLIYAYANRAERRMRYLEVGLLLILPLVHHLVAFISYMMLGYLTIWSIAFVLTNGGLKRRHIEDLALMALASSIALVYYYAVAFGRLAYLAPLTGLLPLSVVVGVLTIAAIGVLSMKRHSRWTFAPVPAIGLLGIILVEYSDPLFPFQPASPHFLVILAAAAATCVFFAWVGFEKIIESKSIYRAIPIGMLLPTATVVLFALLSPAVENKLQLIYRSFDFAIPAMAVGAAVTLCAYYKVNRNRAKAVTAVLVGALLVSLPFGINTSELLGMRHDTQGYEMDTIGWISSHSGSPSVQTDERLSYIGMSVFGIGKDNRLPQSLLNNISLAPDVFYVYEQSWTLEGVNDFPHGTVTISGEFMSELLNVEDVLYVGGGSDHVVVFQATAIGQTHNAWYPWVP